MSREQIIRDTAYAIWEAEGKPHGRAVLHWKQAEDRVAASLTGGAKPDSIAASSEAKPQAKAATAKTPAAKTPAAKPAAGKPRAGRKS